MDYRKKAFKVKFNDAAKHLNVSPNQIISLKVRDIVPSYAEYHELLQALEQEMGIPYHKVDGNLQGTGYLVGDTKSRIIIVEHETGLEILWIVGSIASIVGIIPIVLQCWSSIRGRGRRGPRDFRGVEIRRLDSNGQLVEHDARGIAAPWSSPISFVNTALTSAAEVIDAEIKALRDDVKALTVRVKSLEKKKPSSSKISRKSAKKK